MGWNHYERGFASCIGWCIGRCPLHVQGYPIFGGSTAFDHESPQFLGVFGKEVVEEFSPPEVRGQQNNVSPRHSVEKHVPCTTEPVGRLRGERGENRGLYSEHAYKWIHLLL